MEKISISALIRRTAKLYYSRASIFLIGAVLFGSISAAVSLGMEVKITDLAQTVLAPLKQSGNQLGDFLSAIEGGSIEDVTELMTELQNGNVIGLDALSLLDMLIPVVQIVLWSILFALLISCISSIYYLYCAALIKPSILRVIIKSLLAIPGMILILLWSSVRSLAWVPFIGPFIGILIFPRFLFAPVVYAQQSKSVIVSVRESYAKTAGSTWYILSAISIISLLVFVVAIVVVTILAIFLDPIIGQYSVYLRSIIGQIALGYTVTSLVVMWRGDLPPNS